MRLYEHEAKKALAMAGIAVPRRHFAGASLAAIRALRPNAPVMVKAQVLAGGRGKAGGIVRAETPKEILAACRKLLTSEILGAAVPNVLIEEALAYHAACYLSVTLDPMSATTIILASAQGGVEIEALASSAPSEVLRVEASDASASREVAAFLSRQLDSPGLSHEIETFVRRMLDTYHRFDCTLLEINPLLITESGLVAADAKVVLDNNALFRQRELLRLLHIDSYRHDTAERTGRETRAAAAGFAYVDLLPENARREKGKVYVGLAPGGAGYGIFCIDEIFNIGARVRRDTFVPLNFMDSGGGPSRAAVMQMFSLLFDHPLVDLVITSRFGGISSCDVFIRGLVDCLRDRTATHRRIVPIHGRMVGTDLAAARQYLAAAQRDTPVALAQLHLQTGNDRIMAEVIQDGLSAYLAGKGAG